MLPCPGLLCKDYLRGRMGASFYHAMGFTELIASSADEYVAIATRLGNEPEYRVYCRTAIQHLSQVIWERKEVGVCSSSACARSG